jgi:hypothetical protein
LAGNLPAAELRLTTAELAELDAATMPPPVYPNWFTDTLTDQPVLDALSRPTRV